MNEKTVHILWIYHDLLDLYGDSGNILTLRRRLEQMGRQVTLIQKSLEEEMDFTACDMVVVGAGKTRNLVTAMQDFLPRKEAFLQAVEQGCTVLASGSSKLLLGQGLEADGKTIDGLGLFDYSAREQGQVFVSDCIVRPLFDGADNGLMYGFLNQTALVEYHTPPNLFELVHGLGDTGAPAKGEGMVYKNCFATSLLGPILAKNPHFTRELLKRTLLENMGDYDDRLEQEALRLTLKEFE